MNKIEEINVVTECDESPDTSYLEQPDFEDRLKAYQNGEFHFISIRATAAISYPCGLNGERRLEWLTSGGLYGIESDSDTEYLKSVKNDELTELKDHLTRFNVDVSDFEEKASIE